MGSNAVSDEAMMWFRAAELKHGRAAMLGSVGYLVGAAGITFPGEIAKIKFWDPLNFTGALSAEQKARKRKAELKNGRLAMIGMVSFLIGHNLPGSVPALTSAF